MKKYVSMLLALVMCLSLCATAFAEATTQADSVQMEESGMEPMRWEETKWYYRVLDNYYVQRRLWSCTYGYWLTEWETIGYINPNP